MRHEGGSYIIEIVNPVEYASYVEYGHRTADHNGWVSGHFMMTISEKELKGMEQKTKKYIGTRNLRKNQFVIQYFPHTDDRKGECYDVGEKMLECLEVIHVDGFLLRGTEMKFKIVDGVLHFFVDYDAFSHKEEQKETMELMRSDIRAKG